MLARWLLGAGVLTALTASAPAADEPAPRPDLSGYEAASAAAGRDAAGQVKLALWCEAHGLSAERVKHLAVAVLRDPQNAAARGLLGLVEYGGRWQRPDAVAEKVKADEALTAKLAEYNARREGVGDSAEKHWKLALWCEGAGLQAEAKAHLANVVRLDPSREAAWKRLGCKKVDGRWLTDEQVSAEKAEAEAQRKADRHWKPLLTKWRGWLGDKAKQARAEGSLAGVDDPRAVPAVWSVFAAGDETDQATAVGVLGRIDAAAASRALAALAVYGKSGEVRRTATEVLERRDTRDFLGKLLAVLRDPLKYEVRPVDGLTAPGVLFVEGEKYNVRRVYGATSDQLRAFRAVPARIYDASVPFDPFSAENLFWANQPTRARGGQPAPTNVQAARRDLLIAQDIMAAQTIVNSSRQKLANDVASIEEFNASLKPLNERVYPVLSAVTGTDPAGRSAQDWQGWWTDQQGYAYSAPETQNKPTLTEFVSTSVSTPRAHHACFAAGTPVRTLEGLRAIETVRVGDRVLTQDTETGRLSFAPVLVVYHNKPAPTLRIDLDAGHESVVATGIHRFWKAGNGWAMARDLKPGDLIRTVGATVRVEAVTSGPVQRVFNLEVGEGQSFFVGGPGLLVHDNSLVKPVDRPFDAEPVLAALAPKGK